MTDKIIEQRVVGGIIAKAFGEGLSGSLVQQEARVKNVKRIVRNNGSLIIYLDAANLVLSLVELAAIEVSCHPCGGTGKDFPIWFIPYFGRKVSRTCKYCSGTGVWSRDLSNL